MVGSVTSLTRNGLRDWLIQRVSAVILALYVLCLLGYSLTHAPLTYADWQGLFSQKLMKVFSVLAALSLFYHSWVGVWTVLTDYIKCSCLRLTLTVLVITALLGYLVWGIAIIWGV